MTRRAGNNCRWLLLVLTIAAWQTPSASVPSAETTPRITIAFVSNRGHYWYPHVFLYEHDGVGAGKIIGNLDPQDKRLDHHPALAGNARHCIFGTEFEGQVGQFQYWDLKSNSRLELGDFAKTPNTLFSPSLTADGRWLTFSAWNRPGTSPRWDLFLFDLQSKQFVELPNLNTVASDERRSAISADGNWIAFTTNAPDGRGLTDVRIYDRQESKVLLIPEVNSPAMDSYPCLSGDGRFLCFASDREGGCGGLDIYLFDRLQRHWIDLPGLNSPGHEQSPSISADGRYIAFVSERLDSDGEHDVFLYDRIKQRLLPTPGLNTDRDDYDPCIVLHSE